MTVQDWLEEEGINAQCVLEDYLDDAFVGVSTDGIAVYAFDKMVDCLMDKYRIDAHEAVGMIGNYLLSEDNPVILYKWREV